MAPKENSDADFAWLSFPYFIEYKVDELKSFKKPQWRGVSWDPAHTWKWYSLCLRDLSFPRAGFNQHDPILSSMLTNIPLFSSKRYIWEEALTVSNTVSVCQEMSAYFLFQAGRSFFWWIWVIEKWICLRDDWRALREITSALLNFFALSPNKAFPVNSLIPKL